MSSSSKKKLRKEQATDEMTPKQLTAQKEEKSLKKQTILFVVVLALIVCSAAATLIVRGYRNSGIRERSTIALTINDHKLSTADFSYFYIDGINSFYDDLYSSYGSNAPYYLQMMYGMNPYYPLDQQYYDEENGTTWADYFIDLAEYNARYTYAIYDDAVANDYTMSQDEQDAYDAQVAFMSVMAKAYGYSDLNSYLKDLYGNGSTEKSYVEYYRISAIASNYSAAHSDSINYTDEEIRAYDAEHSDDYNSYSYASYYVSKSKYLTGGTTDEDGNTTYSEAEQQAAVEAARQDAEALVASATSLEALDAAIAKLDYNADSEETVASTKYVDRFYNSVSSTCRDWVSDSARKAGDVTCIPYTIESTDDDGNTTSTTGGYYVLYFQEANDNNIPLVNVRHILVGFEGGTTDSDGNTTYSDEEKAAAKESAEALLKEWESGDATEDSFAALAEEHSTDTGSNSNGGLYTDVYPGEMVTNFNDWCFESGRRPGDTGIVESDYGYHVMYFSSFSDTLYRDFMISSDMLTEEMTEWQDGLYESAVVTEKDLYLVETGMTLLSSY